ncbi:MAG: MmgE/PrpD family protein [Sphingomonadaceae bacterium]
MSEPLLVQLVQTLDRPIAESDRARARLHLLDWLACVAGARQSALRGLGSMAVPVAIGRAALMGNLLEMDDVHRAALLHPGPVIWPTALGCGDDSLKRVLDAALQGYEVMVAIGATLDNHHYAHWHPTATAGLFGAAAAAAALFHLEPAQTVSALANAGSVAGGLWHMRHGNVLTKQWHVLHAVRTGQDAAYMAADGLTGPAEILEGEQGLYAAMCRMPGAMAFSAPWRVNEVSFKPWAACRHAHPAIDCALELRARGQLAAPFRVETYADALAFCDRPAPVSEIEAKFSLQHAVAVIASGRDAGPDDFTPAAIAALAPLRAQVTVAEDPAITARYPAHFGARVNGLELVDTRGDPERPVDEAAIRAKMHTLAAWGGLPPEQAERACALALGGDDAGAITAMLEDWLK